MILTWPPSKFVFIGACASLILVTCLVDASSWTKVLRTFLVNFILYPIISIVPASLKQYILSSPVVGAGFKSVVYLGVNYPNVWQVASDNLLSSKTKNPLLECTKGKIIFHCVLLGIPAI